jgi:hypothetical protein
MVEQDARQEQKEPMSLTRWMIAAAPNPPKMKMYFCCVVCVEQKWRWWKLQRWMSLTK